MAKNIENKTFAHCVCCDETKIIIRDIKELVLNKDGLELRNNTGGVISIPVKTIKDIIK